MACWEGQVATMEALLNRGANMEAVTNVRRRAGVVWCGVVWCGVVGCGVLCLGSGVWGEIRAVWCVRWDAPWRADGGSTGLIGEWDGGVTAVGRATDTTHTSTLLMHPPTHLTSPHTPPSTPHTQGWLHTASRGLS